MAFQAKRNLSTQGFTVVNQAKRQRVLKPESDESDEEIDCTEIQFPQERLTGFDPVWKEWAGAMTKRMNVHAKMIQKLAEERAKRMYYRRYREHCLNLRKFATAKALKTDFQKGTELLWQERQEAPQSFWKKPSHKALAEFIRNEYDMSKNQWESMCEFIQRQNNWAHDGRSINDDILAADLLKLEDTLLRSRVPEIENDIKLHRTIISVQRAHPEIYNRQNEIWNKEGPR